MSFEGVEVILDNVTASAVTSTALWSGDYSEARSFQVVLTGTGAITAQVSVLVSNNNVDYLTHTVLLLSGTTTCTDGFFSEDTWAYWKVKVDSISGTSASIDVLMAY